MFGLFIPQRHIYPSPHETISQTQFAFAVEAKPWFHHFAVFLLPGQVIPPGTVAAIYVRFPISIANSSPPTFEIMGKLDMEKQSALFRLEPPRTSADTTTTETPTVDGPPMESSDDSIVIGVSIELASDVSAQLSNVQDRRPTSASSTNRSLQDDKPNMTVTHAVARQVGQNIYDHLTGFAQGPPGHERVPLKSLQDWWTKFERKLELDPGFMMRKRSAG